jgi:hypothetical protein
VLVFNCNKKEYIVHVTQLTGVGTGVGALVGLGVGACTTGGNVRKLENRHTNSKVLRNTKKIQNKDDG